MDKIIDAFKRSWHFKPGSHPIENSNKLTIFEDGYKSRDAEIKHLKTLIDHQGNGHDHMIIGSNNLSSQLAEAIELIETIQGQIKGHYPKLDSIIEEFMKEQV